VSVFVKRNSSAPQGFFASEAAGLRWLGAVDGGVPCADVIDCDETSLTLGQLKPVAPNQVCARQFGIRLARTHNAGACGFGAGPAGWTGPGFFGPMAQPLPMSLVPYDVWGRFYALERLAPMAEIAGSALSAECRHAVAAVVKRCQAGDFDTDDAPARLHGDLWSGNVMWTADGAVLIDPAAHGGHRETDLAMLALFGCPHLGDIIDGYQSVHPLAPGFRTRVGLHQLYPLLAHVVLFGSGYVRQCENAASAALVS
jgi:fructosamine-3-kinase